ncbi:hypothetical protein [Nocardiopsis halophila]|uniref:hypothetical protein n=1 Tax=Nocardiopsis halophila TaxID=141692 RepID=UPI000344A552|nr:hypothetical protein [Nocardiopsis halophila]
MDEHQPPVPNPSMTPAQQRLLRLFLMLPAPRRPLDDQITKTEAERFWEVMSRSLHAVPRENPQEDAAEWVMETVATLVKAQGDPEPEFAALSPVNLAFRRLASLALEVFGEISEEQRVALGRALRSVTRRPGVWANEWLRLLRETAMEVCVETLPYEGDELAQFSSFWGDPRQTKEGTVQTRPAPETPPPGT